MRFSCISGNYSKLTNNGEGWSRLLKNADRRIVVIYGQNKLENLVDFFYYQGTFATVVPRTITIPSAINNSTSDFLRKNMLIQRCNAG